jgi:acyl-CoA reductase-like NAD-dependent aldehyde dehydrogenase
MDEAFRLTYSTLAEAPAVVHDRLDAALAEVRSNLGSEHSMLIGGQDARANGQFDSRSPTDTELLLARFQDGTEDDVDAAVRAARAAWPAWARTAWTRRIDVVLRAAELLEASAYHLAAVSILEIGKSRLEALGEVHETAALLRWYCHELQDQHGFVRELPKDPLSGFVSRNRAVLKPYGVWAIIAPFSFPLTLAGGPAAAALLTGNCVVYKASSATPWSGWLLARCLREAGVPPGVFNFLTGTAARVGDPLVRHAEVNGITFSGSVESGRNVMRAFASHRYPRPCIVGAGGPSTTLVSRNADLAQAATGIVRSAFALQGQHGAACSRVLVDRVVADQLVDRIIANVRELKTGNPCLRVTSVGPVINRAAYERYARVSIELEREGQLLCGGRPLSEGELGRGYYCEPTVAQLRPEHSLWRQELFLPILLLTPVGTLAEAVELANGQDSGLAAGFYGAKDEVDGFLDAIEAGVVYCNRPQGATTGAWPGYQPIAGWKASGSTGKASGSSYYLQQYTREQSQTIVD